MTPERLTHAIYGGIIVTAAIVAEWGHVEEASEVIGLPGSKRSSGVLSFRRFLRCDEC
jgi:hypothetical protein